MLFRSPLLDLLKRNELKYRPFCGQIATGEAMAALMGHTESTRQLVATQDATQDATRATQVVQRATTALTHPPRPRKKRR